MGFFSCSPNGASFFSMPEPAKGIMYEGLALNVLRSLQFSYMLMKGIRSTTRALKDLDIFGDEDMGGIGGRFKWRSPGSVGGGRLGRIGTAGSNSRVGVGRCSLGTCSTGRVRISRSAGRQARCTGDNLGNRARGEGNLQGKVGENGATVGNGECKVSKGTQGGMGDGQRGDLTIAGDPAKAISLEGTNGGFVSEGSSANGMATGDSVGPAESGLVKKFSNGLRNRTLSAIGWGTLDRISNQRKPIKGFMKSVKMATGVVSGVKTATGVIQKFQAPAGGVLIGFGAANGAVLGFETARMIVKGAKISKDFASVWKSTTAHVGTHKIAGTNAAGAKAVKERFLTGLKASDGALTLVKLTKEFGSGLGGSLQDGLSNWDLVSKSYDASNSVLKVFEAVLGLKGGGMIGLVGKGFTAVKGAIGGMGLSVKLVKAVAVSKEVSIVFFKGFGLSKTIKEAFKATQEGKKIIKWIMFKDGRKERADEDFLKTRRIALLKGGAHARTFELLMTCVQQSAVGSHDTHPSLMYSLASLLLARSEASDVGHPDEDGVMCSSVPPSYIFSLSLPV